MAVLAYPGLARAGDAADKVLLDFRQGSAVPAAWEVEGYAFGTRQPDPRKRQKAAAATPNQRQWRFGQMTSPAFVVNRDYLVVQSAGVYHPELCTVRLVVDGTDVRASSVGSYWFDVRELKGEKAALEVRDHHFNGWLDTVRVVATNRPPPEGANIVSAVPGWQRHGFETTIKGEYLLLPVGKENDAPLQEVAIAIDGEEILTADFPLAFGEIPVVGYLPIYDLSAFQGKKLRVSYHRFTGSEPAKFLLQRDMPGRVVSDRHPAFHVHCRIGRLNDPNGLFVLDGVYHLFHQYAYGIRAKSWAHYVSTDLMHWEERPIALFPDQLGSMHSGSAAVDVLNTSGWQKGDIPPVIAAFTGSRGMGGPDKIQMQGIAYSQDGGRTFTKYGGNPVLGEDNIFREGSDNARDPKIFWFSPTKGVDPKAEDGHWVMVLFEGGGHSLFTSDNLKQWKKQGRIHGFYECPELFPLAVDGNPGDIRWVMYGANGEYHLGTFDGASFEPETAKKVRFHHGNRYYAAQTFSNTAGTPPRRIQVGWQGDQISLPIELSLRTTPLGLRVCAVPVAEIENLYTNTVNLDGLKLAPGNANPLQKCAGGLYDIELDAQLEGAKEFVLDVRGQVIRYDAKSGRLTWGKHAVTLPEAGGRLVLRVVVDNWSVDIFAGEHGLFHIPIFTQLKSHSLSLQVIGGTAGFDRLRVHELKSIW